MNDETRKTCQLQRVYAKDISFEAPAAPDAFLEEWDPKINVQLNNDARRLGEGNEFEVSVTTTVTASREEKTIYLAEVTQAGIFTIEGMEGEELDQILGAYCPGLLFPYLRATITDLVTRGSFPQFVLQPINFDALYRDAKAQREQQEGEGESERTH
jgi:preprotein translocase subunit SecB